ncbi:MAG: peptidoglycan-binding protein [Cellulomonadaceae bacterium]|jgi:hypothetical protein|nr:peptidoglycan-binding protein [Cellulomonadaceae bacterium]
MSQITAAQAVPVDCLPGFRLRKDAADALNRASAAFGKRLLVTGTWRSLETQERIFRERYHQGNLTHRLGYTTDVRYWKGSPWTRRQGTAPAAVPGTSNHGGGCAIDVKTRREKGDPGYDTHVIFSSFNDADRIAFLKAAKPHGWADDEGRSVLECWHLTYYPERDTHAISANNGQANSTKTPAPPKPMTSKNAAASPATPAPVAVPINKTANNGQAKSSTAPIRRTTVRSGSTGTDAKYAQQRLNAHGAKLKVDAKFGANSVLATKAFQRKHGLTPDGIIGTSTWKKLG